MELRQVEAECLTRHRVDVGERLVEEEHAWLDGERTRDRQAAPGFDTELGRSAPLEPGEAEPPGDRLRLARDLRRGEPLLLETEADVLGDREVGPERALLEHVTDAAPARRQEGNVLAVHEDAPARHRQEARNRPQHVGLARLGRAEEREELAVAHVDADLVDARRAAAARAKRLDANVHQRPAGGLRRTHPTTS